MSGVALADTIGRYECSVIGALAQEPIGDRNEHTMVSVQYSCVGMDGLLKGAVNTGISIRFGGGLAQEGGTRSRRDRAGRVHHGGEFGVGE